MRFELLSELGRGSAGLVYKAIDRETRDTVAVKKLLPGTMPPQREVLLARKVTHPNVCRVHDLYRENGAVFISMEFVDGECLKGPLPGRDAIPIAKQICDGLEAVHRQGIAHGDLKPANILIARGGIAKLTDFGLAQSMDPDATAHGAIGGTPAYMAPELLLGEEPDVRSDIYALGMVLKELGLEGPVVSRCLEREPAKRCASASQVRDALEAPVPLFKPATYEGERGYQPMLAVWAETGLILSDEFRDGNVPAMMSPLSGAKAAFRALPTRVETFYYRGDSASHEHELMDWLRDPEREGGPKGLLGSRYRRE